MKIGVANYVHIYDVELKLCYACYKRNNDDMHDVSLTRHGVEYFIDSAPYIHGIHRFSYYCNEMTYKPLSQISKLKAQNCPDVIEVILTGWYGKIPRKFFKKTTYSFDEILYSDGSHKSMISILKNGKIQTHIDWNNFDKIKYLDEEEVNKREAILKNIVNKKRV